METTAQEMGFVRIIGLLTILAALSYQCSSHGEPREVHIVYMGGKLSDEVHKLSHIAMLKKVLGSESKAKQSLVHSYGRSFNGFAARLTDAEAAKFSKFPEVVSVLPNTKLQHHTTRSWNFMGLSLTDANKFPSQDDVIVGLLDTGVWPESESFDDEGLGPAPPRWKGICQTHGNNFTCNKKIIGARYYNSDGLNGPQDFINSPRDSAGQGTHAAATAAGREIPGASYFGLAEGVARGGAPRTRIAVYKICWANGCAAADMLAAFDDAIADGVDIISVSLGTDTPTPYFQDPLAIGSFHAMVKGILTSNSAGNSGPFPRTITNYSPWTLTVAASTIDRKFVSQVVLGNGDIYIGNAVNNFNLNGTALPLVSGGNAVNVSAGSSRAISANCHPGSLNSEKVKGRLVFCQDGDAPSGVLLAEGAGTILASTGDNDKSKNFPLPASVIDSSEAKEVLDYITTTSNPIATIQTGETIRDIFAPIVASFSSRGPNPISPDILKPDLTAPGVDILASWSPVANPSSFAGDNRSVKYNVISGTSVSCPHAAGAAAYVKSAHPGWSAAAIKSALMTTARVMDPANNKDAEFAYGSGHINPLQAVDPGLVFDASEKDYVDFLCHNGYDAATLRKITGDNSSRCSSTKKSPKSGDLNYPSLALAVRDGQHAIKTFHRTVTNVGIENSTYHSVVMGPRTLKISVNPSSLSFQKIGEKRSFTVKVDAGVLFQQPLISGSVVWSNGKHEVRMPLGLYTTTASPSSSLDAQLRRSIPSSIGKNGILKHL